MEAKKEKKPEKPEKRVEELPALGAVQPAFFPPELKYSDMRKRMMERFDKGEYDQLKQDMRAYKLSTQKIRQFFAKEGGLLLQWSLITSGSDKPLKFLIAEVPRDLFLEILKKNQFAIFQSFLLGQRGLEKLGWYNPEKEALQISKFKALLVADAIGIKRFMQEDACENHLLSETTAKNFKTAVMQFEESLSVPVKSSSLISS